MAPSQSTGPHSRSVSLCRPHRRRAGRPHSRPALGRPSLPHRQNHMGRLVERWPSVTRSRAVVCTGQPRAGGHWGRSLDGRDDRAWLLWQLPCGRAFWEWITSGEEDEGARAGRGAREGKDRGAAYMASMFRGTRGPKVRKGRGEGGEERATFRATEGTLR